MTTRKPGRPRLTPPTEAAARIEELAGRGATKAGLAAAMGVSRETFTRWLIESPELNAAFERGRSKVEVALISKLLDKALAGDTVCILFALKAMFGWREGEQPESGRVNITFTLPAAMDREQWATQTVDHDTPPR